MTTNDQALSEVWCAPMKARDLAERIDALHEAVTTDATTWQPAPQDSDVDGKARS
jgi:hypothetical protein